MEEESRYWRETEDVITLMDNEQDAPYKYEERPKYSLTSFSQVLFAIHFSRGRGISCKANFIENAILSVLYTCVAFFSEKLHFFVLRYHPGPGWSFLALDYYVSLGLILSGLCIIMLCHAGTPRIRLLAMNISFSHN